MKKLWLIVILSLVMVYSAFAECNVQAKSTGDFFDEISGLNSNLGACNASIPSPINILFSTETINFQIFMQDGSKKSFMMTAVSSKITEIKEGFSENPTYTIEMGECEFDTLLMSGMNMGVGRYLYDSKKLLVTPVGFWKKIKFGIAIIGVKIGIKSVQADIACSAGLE